MRRYIAADLIEYEPMCRARGNGMYEDCEIAYKDQIDDIQTADVVEVVRCKDCKYWKELLPVCERIHRAGWGVNDYCSFGERKDT